MQNPFLQSLWKINEKQKYDAVDINFVLFVYLNTLFSLTWGNKYVKKQFVDSS